MEDSENLVEVDLFGEDVEKPKLTSSAKKPKRREGNHDSLDDIFTRPPDTEFNFISLGAGVQSSFLAMVAGEGLIEPMPDAAIFVDNRAEPGEVADCACCDRGEP